MRSFPITLCNRNLDSILGSIHVFSFLISLERTEKFQIDNVKVTWLFWQFWVFNNPLGKNVIRKFSPHDLWDFSRYDINTVSHINCLTFGKDINTVSHINCLTFGTFYVIWAISQWFSDGDLKPVAWLVSSVELAYHNKYKF